MIAFRSKRAAEVLVDSTVVEENLPFRFVHYPSLYGVFIGFSEKQFGRPYFCHCRKQAIKNYIELHDLAQGSEIRISEQLIKDFPRTLAADSGGGTTFEKIFRFRNQLCHICNNATPQVRYCHEMYGTKFKQFFGWYIGQMQYRLGFNGSSYLEAQSPPEIQDLLKEFQGISFVHLISSDPEQLLGKYLAVCSTLGKVVENSAREELGFRRIGETWISESVLFRLVQNMFPGVYRPEKS